MAEVFTPATISSLANTTSAINALNANFTAIAALFTDVLARSGTTPNQMLATLDMNSNQIINLPIPLTGQSPVRLQDISTPVGVNFTLVTGNNVWSGTNTFTNTTTFQSPVVSTVDISNILTVSTAPSSLPASLSTFAAALTCDFTHAPYITGLNITGTTALGTPATGYQFNPNISCYYTVFQNSAGHNQSNTASVGRTLGSAFFTEVNHTGQGDVTGMMVNGGVFSTNGSATYWLACPTVSCMAGQMNANISGSNLQGVGDIDLVDNGFDINAVGFNTNLTRTVNTAALGQGWISYRTQSLGTKPVDAGFSLSGPFNIGMDLVDGTFGTNQAAIVMGANQRIYMNATTGLNVLPQNITLGGMYQFYSSANGGIEQVVLGTAVTLFTNIAGTIYTPLNIGFNLANYLTLSGNTTGNAPLVQAQGSDTNIGIGLLCKGSGVVFTNLQFTAGNPSLNFAGALVLLGNVSGNTSIVATSTGSLLITPNVSTSFVAGSNNHVLIAPWGNDGSYNVVSLNNSASASTLLGMLGGNTSDSNLYFNIPNTGNYFWRINNANVLGVSATQFQFLSSSFLTANGAGAAVTFGATTPAAITTPATVFKWLTVLDNLGNTVYIPCWH